MAAKVTFYQSGLESVVWNPKTDSALCEFTRPDFTHTTSDPEVIAILKGFGYQIVSEAGEGVEGEGPQTSRLKA